MHVGVARAVAAARPVGDLVVGRVGRCPACPRRRWRSRTGRRPGARGRRGRCRRCRRRRRPTIPAFQARSTAHASGLALVAVVVVGADREADHADVEAVGVAVADGVVDRHQQLAEARDALGVGGLDVDEARAAGRRRRRCRPGACHGRTRRGGAARGLRASKEKSGPLTTRPGSARSPTGVMPESISATSTPSPLASRRSAPIVRRTSASVVASAGDAVGRGRGLAEQRVGVVIVAAGLEGAVDRRPSGRRERGARRAPSARAPWRSRRRSGARGG